MEQKRVSLKVAKTIKEAGYPLVKVVDGRYDGHSPIMYDKPITDDNWADCEAWYLPTYIDVWLWLWKVKDIFIDIASDKHYKNEVFTTVSVWDENISGLYEDDNQYISPEDAIIAAIDYLVDNELIK